MSSGRLDRPTLRPSASTWNPNVVAITTSPRNGDTASPTSFSSMNGASALAVWRKVRGEASPSGDLNR
jgi:hypothetical protein